jgi:MFS family permease
VCADFDIRLARASALIEAICWTCLVSTSSPAHFLVFVALDCLGGGAMPAINSLALSSLANPTEDAGKLFAGLGMLQASMSQVVGPLMMNLLYSATVRTFAEAIFVLGASIFGMAFVCLCIVRVGNVTGLVQPQQQQEQHDDGV